MLERVSDEMNARAKANGFDQIDAPTGPLDPELVDNPTARATLCYVQGEYNTPVPPGVVPPDLAVSVMVNGKNYPLLAGYSQEHEGYPPIEVRPPEEGR